MYPHFTVTDISATVAAIFIFPLFVIVPGYVLGWLFDLVSFRHRTPLIRLLLSLPLSIAITPVLVDLLGRLFSMRAVWVFYSVIWIIFAVMLAISPSREGSPNPRAGKFPANILTTLALISIIWILFAVLSLVDLQIGNKLYFSAVSYDYTVRSAAVSQLARTEWLPPSNPFFFPGSPEPFRYHYFWFLICSLPVRLLGGLIGPRHGLFAGVVWIGFTLMATIALYLRLFNTDGRSTIRRRTLLALGLLCVSGFDILPTVFLALCRLLFHRQNIYPSVDWWNRDQVTGWLDSCFWVPHHLSSLIACMTAFLILWDWWKKRVDLAPWQLVFAGTAIASSSGLSLYVAFVFGTFLVVWTILVLFRKEYRLVGALVLVGVVAVVTSAPFLWDLVRAGTSGTSGHATGKSASFMRFGIRMFDPAHLILKALHVDRLRWTIVADLLLLPVNLLCELGVLFLIGLIKIRRWLRQDSPLSPVDQTGVVMMGVALTICIFVRSNTIETNDLGIRGMLIVQFLLVIWGADVIAEWRAKSATRDRVIQLAQACLGVALVLGLATNVYELCILRTYTILTDAGVNPGENLISPGPDFGRRTFSARQLYSWLDTNTSRLAVYQPNPLQGSNLLGGLYANRQMGLVDVGTAVSFGGDPKKTAVSLSTLTPLFSGNSAPDQVDLICTKLKISYLIAQSDDTIWQNPESWVWRRKPVFASAQARAFACGDVAR